ncbi:hypothetical protein [Cellulomonas massiliensis]|uniref:hypothetical protein n=1 Tax=Cellulomonas massiliensis TaxID=1465811 RepID=UPI0002DF3D8B|nr:hypothetical protein [Cellulomonas massiliensis]
MARVDAVRHRIAVTDDELETLRRLSNGDDVEAGARERLAADGLLDGEGLMTPFVADLVRTMAEPMIRCVVETAGPQGAQVAVVSVREERVWYTDPWPQDDDEGATAYHQDELPQLLWILARLVGLRRHDVPKVARPFTVPLRAIDAVLQAMALGERAWEPARTVATAELERLFGDVAEDDRMMLLATLSYLEATARVTMIWGPEPTDARGLALWACGPGGYWVRTSPAEPLAAEDITPDALATFEPVAGGQVWEALAALLPSSAELRALVDRVSA